jgi:predicted nucleic acid-binding protein
VTGEVGYLIDTSATVQLTRPEVAGGLSALVEAGRVATCAVVDLELYSLLHDPADLGEIKACRAASFHWLPTNDEDLRRALDVQTLLIESRQLSVSWTLLVVAAVAERHRVTVLHCEPAFDRIAAMTGQPTEWVVRP